MRPGNALKPQIHSSMTLKTTEELVEIWENNDHTEWSGDAFDVVRELLLERLGSLPKQKTPIGVDVGFDVQKSADTLLKDYETKGKIAQLLDIGLYICISFTAISVFYAITIFISWLSPESRITVSGSVPWYFIVCTLSLVPIYILRKRVKSDLEMAKIDIIKMIEKGLGQK